MLQKSTRHYLVRNSLQYVAIILCIGSSIGLLVSLVSSFFVYSVQWLLKSRAMNVDVMLVVPGTDLSLLPMLWLVVAALLLVVLRRDDFGLDLLLMLLKSPWRSRCCCCCCCLAIRWPRSLGRHVAWVCLRLRCYLVLRAIVLLP